MDCSFPMWSVPLHYDAVQLNRIEFLLMQLMTKLSGKDDVLKIFDAHVSNVPSPCVSGPLDAEVINEVSASKSKQRRRRMAECKRKMWSQLQERAEEARDVCEGSPQDVFSVGEGAAGVEGLPAVCTLDCETTSETLGTDSSAMMRMMFQKLLDIQTKVDGVSAVAEEANAIAEEANLTASRAKAVAETIDCEMNTETDVPAVQVDKELLQSLKGQRKEDVVLKLFLNRPLDASAVEGTLKEMERYFESDLEKIGSFLSMKFGIRTCSWSDLRHKLLVEVSGNSEWQNGCTLGMVLKDMRKQRSNNRANSAERARHLTDELVKPRRKKKHK